MLLTKLRKHLSSGIEVVAKVFVKIGFKPLYLTISSLIFSTLAFTALYYYKSIILYITLVLLSGFMDMVDGAVARLTKQVSRLGAFLDSTIDRFSDILIIYPLTILGFPVEQIVYLIVVSLMISYVRARGEALNLKIEGIGIIERAERIVEVLGEEVLEPINIFETPSTDKEHIPMRLKLSERIIMDNLKNLGYRVCHVERTVIDLAASKEQAMRDGKLAILVEHEKDKKNGLLVNLSRGAVINESDLYKSLQNKFITGAAIDVWYNYQPEPDEQGRKFPASYPFYELENVVLSPHRAASPFNDLNRWDEVIENISRLARKKSDFLNVVELQREY